MVLALRSLLRLKNLKEKSTAYPFIYGFYVPVQCGSILHNKVVSLTIFMQTSFKLIALILTAVH